MSLRGFLRNVLQAMREDGRARKPTLLGHGAVAIFSTSYVSALLGGVKISGGRGGGVKVIKAEDQKCRMADSSLNMSNKCRVC